jgi:hypothetical protein
MEMMVPTVPLVAGSVLSMALAVAFGAFLAVLVGMAFAAAERRSLMPAEVREEQRRVHELHRRRPARELAQAA